MHAQKTITVKYTVSAVAKILIAILIFMTTIPINTCFVSLPRYIESYKKCVNLPWEDKFRRNFLFYSVNRTVSKLAYYNFKTTAQYLHLCSGRCLKWYHCGQFSAVSNASYIVGSQIISFFSGLASIQRNCVDCLCFLVKESKTKWKLRSGSDGLNGRIHTRDGLSVG